MFADKENLRAKKLFEENMGIVYSMYNKYKNKYNIEPEDLWQECQLSLWKAATKFNPEKGCKFSTYAFTIIENKIIDLIKNSNKNQCLYYEDIIKCDKIEDGYKQLTGTEVLGENDNNLELVLDDIDTKQKVEDIKKAFGEDVNNIAFFLKLRNDGYDIPTIKSVMNLTDDEVEKIRRKLRFMKKNIHNLNI